jgi:hypothetical protein
MTMSRERWLRGGDETPAFDWSAEARKLDVPLDVARALYLRAARLVADPERAEQLYLRRLRAAAEARRAAAPRPVAAPGRRTRLFHEPGGAADERTHRDQHAPGRTTRVLYEAIDGDAQMRGGGDVQRALSALMSGIESGPDAMPAAASAESAVVLDSSSAAAALHGRLVAAAASGQGAASALADSDPATATAVLRELRSESVPGHTAPLLRLVTRAADGEVERMLSRGSTGIGLPADVVARLAPHVGRDAAGAARLHTGDTADLVAAAHHARALTLGQDIFFARGEYAPGSERGDELLVHELTHVAQGQRGELARAAAKGIDTGGPLDAAEAEADLRARFAALQLHAPTREVPARVQPTGGQPASPEERTARIAAQQERVTLANQVSEPLSIQPALVITPQAPEVDPASATPTTPATTATTTTATTAPTATGNAYVDVFQAQPSMQAMELWEEAGTEATTQFADEQARFDAALPEIPIVLEGFETPAAGDGIGGHATVSTESTDAGATPPAAETIATPEAPPVIAADAVVEAIPASTDTAQMQADAQQALDALPTTAPNVSTDPGPAPMTELAGQADPVCMLGDQQQALTDGIAALDPALTAIVTGPGPAQIQPIDLDETLAVPPADDAGAMPVLPAVEGMAKFKSWNLPADVQATFDGIAKPKMDANLAEAQAQMTAAESQRDADRALAVADAQEQVRLANVDADLQQQTRIAETRTRIANQQADTLLRQQAEVARIDQQAGERRTTTVTRINDRITADQATVETNFQDAQRRADDRRVQGEAEAAQKKQDAQDQAANQSWWDQLVGSIVDAIQSIADEINQVLDAIGEAVGQILEDVKNAACQIIDAACNFVCQELAAFGDWLKSEVTALIGTVFPELAAELNRLIDQVVVEATAAVTAIADDLKTAVTALCDGLKEAIDAAIATFKAAVDAAATFATALVTGDWSVVGKMFLDGILQLLGIDPAAFYALIGEAEDSIEKIIQDPGAFVGHLIDAVKLGFQQFGDNFLVHLQDGLIQWLVGTLGGAGIHMPASFDLAGIFDLVCQVLGLTWPRLRQKVVAVIGEDNTERLEFVAQYIEAFLAGGFAGLWEQVQQDLSNLWDIVVGGIQDWLIQNVVQAAILRIATMWNPVGAILQLIQTAWTTYQWLRENAQRIFGLVEAVVHSVSSIVAGDISGAANLVESSLARLVPIAISLFADLLGLGGIADEIQRIIGDVQALIDQAIDALIERVKALFRGGDGDADAENPPEVPRSLEEPSLGALANLSEAVAAQVREAEPGQVIYQSATADPQEATEQLLANHPDAAFDTTTGKLTLPPIDTSALAAATSLEQLGQIVAQQTGVSKVTLDKNRDGIALRGHINPDAILTDRWKDASDDELRAHLGPLAQDMWKKMQDAYAANKAPVQAPDGNWLATNEAGRGRLPGRGPCLSLVMDRQTGQVFYRQNTGTVAVPRDGESMLEPTLLERTQEVIKTNGPSPTTRNFPGDGWRRGSGQPGGAGGYPGSHGEVQGSNDVLRARSGAVMGDIVIYNIRTEHMSASPAPTMPRCANCVVITEGATVLTD